MSEVSLRAAAGDRIWCRCRPRRSAVLSITNKPWTAVFFALSALVFDRSATTSCHPQPWTRACIGESASRRIKSKLKVDAQALNESGEQELAVQLQSKTSAERRKMTVLQGIFRREGTAERRGLQQNRQHLLATARSQPNQTITPYWNTQ